MGKGQSDRERIRANVEPWNSDLTPMITRMEANGWLRKERSKSDERNVYISLQAKARDEKQAITDKVAVEIQACHIDLEEYMQLLQGLKGLQERLKGRSKLKWIHSNHERSFQFVDKRD